ncbi:hypothetical protein PA01_18315 [Azoarcus sp. PA01]|nr:hypothetical protein PA01_19500 [Azoarcus sp. PA01]KAI5913738.1 hypothetical protein PA01_18315 [Azoarcus sp. PA01]
MSTNMEAYEGPLSGEQDRAAVAALLALVEVFINAATPIELDGVAIYGLLLGFRWRQPGQCATSLKEVLHHADQRQTDS